MARNIVCARPSRQATVDRKMREMRQMILRMARLCVREKQGKEFSARVLQEFDQLREQARVALEVQHGLRDSSASRSASASSSASLSGSASASAS